MNTKVSADSEHSKQYEIKSRQCTGLQVTGPPDLFMLAVLFNILFAHYLFQAVPQTYLPPEDDFKDRRLELTVNK